MNQLHVFGDSFADASAPDSWVNLLGNLLNLKVNGNAVGGSAIEYSYLKLIENENNIDDGDIVIFTVSSPERWDLEYYLTKEPHKAGTVSSLRNPNCQLDDQDHLRWYVTSRSLKLIENKAALYMSYVHSLSVKFANTKFIVLSSFKESLNSSVIKKTSNFTHLNTISLNELSNQEWDLANCPSEMFYPIYGVDPRTNHMTNPNLNQLAKILYRVITTGDDSTFSKDSFFKKVVNKLVITHEDSLLNYINTNLITSHTI
jgi:hypothetical protein